MLPHSTHRPRHPILLSLAVLTVLGALALIHAPAGQAIEYPYPYPEEPAPSPSPSPSPNPYPTPSPSPTPQPPATETGSTMRVVKEARSKKLGHMILTNRKGHTLYSLSVEKKGRFICDVSACLTLWKPLTVPAGVKPVGPVHLGTIVRPDGRTQVTFRGLPLYRFTGDTKPGDVSGEGFRDVGVWHAAGGTH